MDITPKPKLEVIEGGKVDPSDSDIFAEELDALTVKLRENILTLDAVYDPIKRFDPQISMLRNGLDIVLELAEHHGKKSLMDVVDESIKGYVTLVETNTPRGDYASAAKDMADALEVVNEAIFNSHPDDLNQKFRSDVWQEERFKRASDALQDGLAHGGEIIVALNPIQPGEDRRDYKDRLMSYLGQGVQIIRERAEKPPL